MVFLSEVTDISWERIHLYITLKITNSPTLINNLHFYLIKGANKKVEAEFDIHNVDGNLVTIHLNITNTGLNQCVTNGTYNIISVSDDNDYSIPKFYGTNKQLEDWCRLYRYNGNKGAYTITFELGSNLEAPDLKLLFYNLNCKGFQGVGGPSKKMGSFRKYLSKKKKKLRSIRSKASTRHSKHLIAFCKLVFKKKRSKSILFLSYQNNYMTPNMEAIYNRMKDRGLLTTYNTYFFLEQLSLQKLPFFMNLKLCYYVGRCGTIIVDDHVRLFDFYKIDKSDTKLIQIWHAGAGFKSVGFSRWGHKGPGPYSAHRQYTYAISPSSVILKFFSEQFGIMDEQIIPTGMPRLDEYLSDDHRAEVTAKLYQEYPELKGRFVVLFAPTYRGNGRKTAFYPYDMVDFEKFYNYSEEKNAVILFKMHPWVNNSLTIPEEYKDRLIDMSMIHNINDLFYITDLLITDYSSSMYEFMLMKKPMLFYAFDKTQFSSSRGFHRDYESNILGKLCESFDELIKAMKDEDYEFYKVEASLPIYFDNVDTNSSDRVIDWLILDNLPQSYKDKLENQRQKIKEIKSLSFSKLMEDEESKLTH